MNFNRLSILFDNIDFSLNEIKMDGIEISLEHFESQLASTETTREEMVRLLNKRGFVIFFQDDNVLIQI